MPRKPRRSISPSVSIRRLSRAIPWTAHCATYPTIMQALSAAIRCSWGLAARFEPPSSKGSSMSKAKRRGTCSPPIWNPLTTARLRVWPCQVVATRQLVLAFAASRLTPSISPNRSSRLMPLTMVGSAALVWAVMFRLLRSRVGSFAAGSVQGGERRLDAPTLVVGNQDGEHVAEMAVAGARVDVLPAVGVEERGLDRGGFVVTHGAAAGRREIARVGPGLRLQNAVDRGHQLDELVDRLVAFGIRHAGVVTHPFDLVDDRVLGLFLPMVAEDVLEQFGELVVGIDALAVVELREKFDIERQRQDRPGALAEHQAGDGVGVDAEAIADGQGLADHLVDAAEQRLMLQFLVTEPDQRLERELVAEPIIPADLQHLGGDEALDQPEHLGVGAPLDLADEALLVLR